MAGMVVRLRVYQAKGDKGSSVERVDLEQGVGLIGDFHANAEGLATKNDRQISLFSLENREWIDNAPEKGLCFHRFKENITTQGLALENLKAGARLKAGTALLEISGESKRCHEECVFLVKGETCRLSGQNLFAKVVESGVLQIGDNIENI